MINATNRTFSSFTMYKGPDAKIIRTETAYTGIRICLVTEGDAVWHINGQCYTVEKGDIILFNDFQKRRIAKYGRNGFTVYVIQLDRSAFVDISDYLFFGHCIKSVNGVLKCAPLSYILEEISEEDKDDRIRKYEMMSAKLTEFFIGAERHLYDNGINICIDTKIAETLDYIDSNITDNISLTAAAHFAGFSESAFSKRFAKATGATFKKYVMSRKTERAVHLLKTTDYKVIDIAYACGFDSISGFYDTFKKVTGTTPGKISEII